MDNKGLRLNSFKFTRSGSDSPLKLDDAYEPSRSKEKKKTHHVFNQVNKDSCDSIDVSSESHIKRKKSRFVTVNFVRKGTIMGPKRPETTIEKIIKIIKNIKEKLAFYKELDLVEDAEWIIREVLKNDIYRFNVEDDLSSKMDREFYNEYSSFKLYDNLLVNEKTSTPSCRTDSTNSSTSLLNFKPLSPITPSNKQLIDTELVNTDLGPNFDIFKFSDEIGRENVLKKVTDLCFSYKNVSSLLDKDSLDNFIEEIRLGYVNNKAAKYHSELHAADVLQTVFHLCYKGNFDKIMYLDQSDILSLFFASLIHDYKHPGFTNMFLINSKDEIAYKYNGINTLYIMFRYFSIRKLSSF